MRAAWAIVRVAPTSASSVIASLAPVTNAALTEFRNGIYALKCKDAIIFSPHPASKKTTNETVRIMRTTLKEQGAPKDTFQCIEAQHSSRGVPDVDLRPHDRDRPAGRRWSGPRTVPVSWRTE
jgi:hypothetical protein